MNRHELRSGAAAGLLAAAATAGAMVAIGARTATASRPFNVIASHFVGSAGRDAFGLVPRVTFLGLAAHAALMTLLGVGLFAIVRRGLAPVWLVVSATALLCSLVSIGIARRGGLSLADLFSVGDLVVYYLLFALSLGVGIRIALSWTPNG